MVCMVIFMHGFRPCRLVEQRSLFSTIYHTDYPEKRWPDTALAVGRNIYCSKSRLSTLKGRCRCPAKAAIGEEWRQEQKPCGRMQTTMFLGPVLHVPLFEWSNKREGFIKRGPCCSWCFNLLTEGQGAVAWQSRKKWYIFLDRQTVIWYTASRQQGLIKNWLSGVQSL